jgi:hypothetical protein
VVRVIARAEGIDLARGSFDRALKRYPDQDIRLCCGAAVLVTSG